MRRIACLALALVFAAPQARGDTPCDRAKTVRRGDVVACDEGIILPVSWGLNCAEMKTVQIPGLKNDLKRLREKGIVDRDLAARELASERRFSKKQSSLLDAAIEPHPSTWVHPGLWMAIGLVIGAGSVIAVTYAVRRE